MNGREQYRQITQRQKKILFNFLNEHKKLARGKNNQNSSNLWNQCAKKLNSVNGGAIKNGRIWARCWRDWKYKVRCKYRILKEAIMYNKPLPDGFTNFTSFEKKILEIIVDDMSIIDQDPSEDFQNIQWIDDNVDEDNRESIRDDSNSNQQRVVTESYELSEPVDPRGSNQNQCQSTNGYPVFSIRQKVSPQQRRVLVDFLKEHHGLGHTLDLRNKEIAVILWNQCAEKLNSIDGGAFKDGKGWSVFWCKWKHQVKCKYLEQKVAIDKNTPLPEGFTQLTPLEEDVMSITAGVIMETDRVIKKDPLEDYECNNDNADNDGEFGDSDDNNDDDNDDDGDDVDDDVDDDDDDDDDNDDDDNANVNKDDDNVNKDDDKVNKSLTCRARKHQRVTPAQKKILLNHLLQCPIIAKGLTKGRNGPIAALQWKRCAKKLNCVKGGAYKDAKAWSKFWSDWKYRLKCRYMEQADAISNNKPLPEGYQFLSSAEKKILSVIGDVPMGDIFSKTNPFENNENNYSDVDDDRVSINDDSSSKRRSEPAETFHTSEQQEPEESNHEQTQTNNKHIEDEAAKFIAIEKRKLENSSEIKSSLQVIASQLTRLTDVMSDIRDALVGKF